MYIREFVERSHLYVAERAAWNSGTDGSRRPLSMPETTVVLPLRSVEVRVERISASFQRPETPTSHCEPGDASKSTSTPRLRALGTLKTTRDEQVPAVTVVCRLSMSM